MQEVPERAIADATMPAQVKAEDLLRVTKPRPWLKAVTGLYLNIMRPDCAHRSLHWHVVGLDDAALVSTGRSG